MKRLYSKHQIEWVVRNCHVSASDDEIRALVARKTKSWPAKQRGLAVKDALKAHLENQKLYLHVMSGRIGECR
ncbi:MAG: hypothetical protein ACRD2L_01205 [Terriglobia bacterium]